MRSLVTCAHDGQDRRPRHDHGSSPISRLLGTAAAAAVVAGASRRPRPPAHQWAHSASRVRNSGCSPGSADDQSRAFQRAIDETARNRTPLAIAPGSYRVGNLRASRQRADRRRARRDQAHPQRQRITDQRGRRGARHALRPGARRPAPPPARPARPPAHRERPPHQDRRLRNPGAGGTAIACTAVDGEIVDTLITDSADVAIHSFDARALLIARNTIAGAGNNGIQVWRGKPGDDGTIVTDNRIEAIENRSGGSGQYGNAVNVFRAANVIVRGNRIRNCAFTAVRGNAASNFQIARQQHHRRARGRDLCRVRLRGRAGRQQYHRRRGDRRLDHQFQPGRTARERHRQHHPQPAAQAAGRHRPGRRRRHRHRGRGRHRGDRQRDRERARPPA